MKLETEPQDVAVHGDFKTSEFKTGDTAFIVDMFADKVYSNKVRAVIREISCNAHDSHVMAGTEDVPFDVHVPTHLEPFFSVRDYGTGLSDEEVRDYYAGIGISTKRNDNKVIGCFGIGTLSPYSMSDSFTVKSWKDGVCRTYSCYRDEKRVPIVSLLTECDSDQANGVEVSVSVEGKAYEFSEEAVKVFTFWQGTLPNINDKQVVAECERARGEYCFEGEDYGMTNSWGSMVAVMGNISYKIPYELDEFRNEGYLRFDLGELSFDSGRENLALDTKTKEALVAKFEKVRNGLTKEVTDKIDSLGSDWERAGLANDLNKGALTTRIKADLRKYDLPTTTEEMTYFSGYRHSWRGTERSTTNSLPLGDHVEYYAAKPRFVGRIKAYVKDQNSSTTVVLLNDLQITETGIPTDLIRDLEDLPKLATAARKKGSPGSTCKVFTLGKLNSYNNRDNWIEAEVDMKDSTERVYVEISRFEVVDQKWFVNSASNIRGTLKAVNEYIGDVQVHGLKTAVLNTKGFKEGNWISLDEYLKREMSAVAPKKICVLSDDSYRRRETADLICSLADMVDDDKFAEFKTLREENKPGLKKILTNLDIEVEESSDLDDLFENIIESHKIFDIIDVYDASKKLSVIAGYIGLSSDS